MTFDELQRGVFDDLQYQPQPKPGVQDRIRRYLNEGLERVLRRPRLKSLRLLQLPLTSIPGQGFYAAPEVLERIDYIIDTVNGRRLTFRTRDWYRALDPSVRTSGTPAYWIPEGFGPALRQPQPNPAGEVEIYVKSHHAADTNQIARVRVQYMHGTDIELEAALNGTATLKLGPMLLPTGVEVALTTAWLTATAFGTVQFSDKPGPWTGPNDLIAQIQAGQLTARHLGYRLYPTPTAAFRYELEGQRMIPRMTLDEDEPPFHPDYHEMLQCYARARFYRKDGRLAQSQAEMAEFERYALDLTATVEYPVNYRPVAGKLSVSPRGWSDVGPHYPATRIVE